MTFEKLQFYERQQFRVLTCVEMGMKSHELVSSTLIASLSGIKSFNVEKMIGDLVRDKMLKHKNAKTYDGYKLTFTGYDHLALNTLKRRFEGIEFGTKIGCGKESEIFRVKTANERFCIVKLHHLGRRSFKTLKQNRDFHRDRSHISWIYVSRLSAIAEYSFMKVLNNHNLPVPMALDCNRNAVLMDYIDGDLLAKMDFNDSAVDIDDLFQQCLDFLIELSSLSLVHGDFNEFNIMVKDKRKIVVIDFPQTLSVYSDQAERIYERDLNSVVTFFEKQGATPKELPQFNEIQVKERCDIITKATGYENSDFLAQYTIENLKLKPEITNGINEFFESDDEVNNLDDGGNEAPHLPETQVDSSSKNSGDWIEKRVKHEFRIKRVKNEQRQTRHHQINSQKRKIRHMTKTFS